MLYFYIFTDIMRTYDHLGVPTTEKKPGESLKIAGKYKFYSTPYAANPSHIMWHRFPKDHGLPEILTELPHIAFMVDNLEEEIAGKEVIVGPYFPIKGYKVAIILEDGFPVELIETSLTEQEITEGEKTNIIKTL